MELSIDLMDDISKNVRNYRESKKKYKKIDFRQYSTARLKCEIVKYDDDPDTFITIYNILKVRLSPVVISYKSMKQLERERMFTAIPVYFGNKDESYMTEEEAQRKFCARYEDLSKQEKAIYDSL